MGGNIDAVGQPADEQQVDRNAECVADRYSPTRTAERLQTIYRQLLDAPIDPKIAGPPNAGGAAEWIKSTRPFYPCRTEVI